METLGFAASFAMGITLGLMGGGGSILTVPILIYLFHLPPLAATGYSLFVVGITALIGSALYIRKGDVDFKTGLIFAVPSMVGVNVARGVLIPWLPDVIFRGAGLSLSREVLVLTAFAILMMSAAYAMIRKREERRPATIHPWFKAGALALEGFIVGIAAGFVGAGGGFLILPALVLLAGLPMRAAVGTSLLIIALQSLIGFAGDLSRGVDVNWSLLGAIAVIAAAGIVAGSVFAHKIKERSLNIAFGWFVLVMGSAILIDQIRHL